MNQKLFRVHLYELVRIPVEVEAESHLEAAQKADASLDRHASLDACVSPIKGEWAEETIYAMVDVIDKPQGEFIDGQTVDYNATSEGFEVAQAEEPATTIALRTAYREMACAHARLKQFAEMISRLTKDGEKYCAKTGRIVEVDDSTLSGDDAAETVGSLITAARALVGEPPARVPAAA